MMRGTILIWTRRLPGRKPQGGTVRHSSEIKHKRHRPEGVRPAPLLDLDLETASGAAAPGDMEALMPDFTRHKHPVPTVPCGTCHANTGAWCRRPSGHRATDLHLSRGGRQRIVPSSSSTAPARRFVTTRISAAGRSGTLTPTPVSRPRHNDRGLAYDGLRDPEPVAPRPHGRAAGRVSALRVTVRLVLESIG